MSRCEYRNELFKDKNTYCGDGTEYCWVQPVKKFGTEEDSQNFCIFHTPEEELVIDGKAWTLEEKRKEQAELLFDLLNQWNDANTNRGNEHTPLLEFILPGLHCGTFNCPDFEFSGLLSLKDSTFQGNVIFRDTTFKKEVCFANSKFFGETLFNSATFNGNAAFDNVTFNRYVAFNGSTFFSKVFFLSATFAKESDFRSVKFKKEVTFSSVGFMGKVSFERGYFSDEVYFRDSNFETGIVFDEVPFHKKLVLSKCHVGKPSQLVNCSIHNLRYDGHTGEQFTLNHCTVLDQDIDSNIKESSTWEFKYVDCSNLTFLNMHDMSKIDFYGANIRNTIFDSCIWKGQPYSKVYRHDDTFANLEKSKEKTNQFLLLQSLYQQLKINLENNRDYKQSGDFHFREMEIRQKIAAQHHWMNWEWIILFIYRNVGDYGESYKKLFGSMLISILLTTFIIALIQNPQWKLLLHSYSNHIESIFFGLIPTKYQSSIFEIEVYNELNFFSRATLLFERILLGFLILLLFIKNKNYNKIILGICLSILATAFVVTLFQGSPWLQEFTRQLKNITLSLIPSRIKQPSGYFESLYFSSKFLIVIEGLVLAVLTTLFVMAIRRRFRR
jgi:uncharacterized protein YjbI with pentapeptide repeats